MSQRTEVDEPTSFLLNSLARLTKSLLPNRQLDPLSFSSQQCASWRAMEMRLTDPLVTDPYAETLAGCVAMSRAEKMGQPRYPRFSVRTRFFDDFASQALTECTQVVLLGAGMDMRAYRLTAVTKNIKVFEIDVDSVINLKEQLLSTMTPPPQPRGQLTRVRADVTSDWRLKLLKTTFDCCEKTAWLVEGLVYYLDQGQVDALFAQIYQLSAFDSVVCFSAVSKLGEGRKGLASMFKSAMSDPKSYLEKFGFLTTRIVKLGGPEANYGRWPSPTEGPRRESTIYVTAWKIISSAKQMRSANASVSGIGFLTSNSVMVPQVAAAHRNNRFCAPISLHRATRLPLRVSSVSNLSRSYRQRVTQAPCPILMNQSQQETPSEADAAVDLPETLDEPKEKPKYSQRARLREETEAPFRKARMFVYGGSALSASVGAFIASLRVIAALTGVSGVQPLNETLPNIGINLAVIAVCGALLRFETKAGERRLERMSRGARIASLRIQDAVTRQVRTLKDLRGRTRVVLVAGPVDKVVQAMEMSEEIREGISKSNLMIIPYVTDQDDTDTELRNWRMKPFAGEEWKRWYDAEREVVNARLRQTSDVLVILVRLDGKVGARSVGAPMWPRLIGDISKLPKRDQYGKP